jgi:myo-inositol-1(or 4)-monophosphatase
MLTWFSPRFAAIILLLRLFPPSNLVLRAMALPAAADFDRVRRHLEAAALKAGQLALRFFQAGAPTQAKVSTKDGGSPVTEADHLVDQFLAERLRPLFPEAAWLSEESVDDPLRLHCRQVLIADPIDGTRGFMAGDRRWTICIALTMDGRPVAGVVHAPALAETYIATAGGGAFLNGMTLAASNRCDFDGARVAGPRAFSEALAIAGRSVQRAAYIPSLAYRFARVATGSIDAGLAAVNSHDWDLAAVDVIVHEAGGRLTGLDGEVLIYNRPLPRHGVLVAAGARLHPRILAEAQRLVGTGQIVDRRA